MNPANENKSTFNIVALVGQQNNRCNSNKIKKLQRFSFSSTETLLKLFFC